MIFKQCARMTFYGLKQTRLKIVSLQSKIVLGVMIGHHDAANEYTSLEDAVDAVDYVKSQDLAGVMTWDINRDCDQRMNYPAGQVFYTLLDKPNLT